MQNLRMRLSWTAIASVLLLASQASAGWGRTLVDVRPVAPVTVTNHVVVPSTTYYVPATTTYYAPPVATHYAPTTAYYAPPAVAVPAIAPRTTYFAPGGTVITTMPRHRVGRPILTTPAYPAATPAAIVAP